MSKGLYSMGVLLYECALGHERERGIAVTSTLWQSALSYIVALISQNVISLATQRGGPVSKCHDVIDPAIVHSNKEIYSDDK